MSKVMEKTTIVCDSALEEKIKKYKELDIAIKALTSQCNSLKDEIKTYMNENGHNKMSVGSYTCTISECNKSGIDTQFLKTYFPDIYAKCQTSTSYQRFTVK